METSLHRALKERYGAGAGGRTEVFLGGLRIDAVDGAGHLVEIQSGSLGPLRTKLHRLLPGHHVRVVKPVVLGRRVVRRARIEGVDLSARRSPKRGAMVDVFGDLVGLARVFPHPNLQIEVLAVTIDEIRIPRRRWPGYAIADRRLHEILGMKLLVQPADLWDLLPGGHDWCEPFTTTDIAHRIERPLWFAQQVAYCLRLTGAAQTIGSAGHRRVYVKQRSSIPVQERRLEKADL